MATIEQQLWQGTSVYVLENEALRAVLCPALGNNLVSIQDKALNREVLRMPESPEQLQQEPVMYGTPILIPPNRIRQGQFTYADRTYQFEQNVPNGNHIHGFHRSQPWNVAATRTDEQSCEIVCTLATSDFADITQQYPHELELTMTFTLTGSSLTQQLAVRNAGHEAAPFGFGLHTWFMVDGEPDRWTFQLPVERIWKLDEQLCPTGELVPLSGRLEQLPAGIPLSGLDLDTVFQIGEQPKVAVLKRDDVELHYRVSDKFKQWVIYTMGDVNTVICLEPYTWVTNAPNLPLPAEQTGFTAIAAGDTLSLDITLDIVHK